MTSKRNWALLGVAIAVAFAFAQPARATVINFTVDTQGSAQGGTLLAPTAANIGSYRAGSYQIISGKIAAVASGISATANFSAEVAAGGTFNTGNPGSLEGFYSGSLLANVNAGSTTISFPGGSALNAANYTSKYPAVANPAVPLSPEIGGGTAGKAQTIDPADYGVSLKLTALGGLVTAATGTAALRGAMTDITQNGSVLSQALSSPVAGTQTFTVAGNIATGITGGTIDYNLSGTANLAGSSSLVGAPFAAVGATQKGTLTTVVVDASRQIFNYYITVPTTATIVQSITGTTPATITITVTGQMAAFANNVQVPEPATFALAGFAAVPLGFLAWRRRKRA